MAVERFLSHCCIPAAQGSGKFQHFSALYLCFLIPNNTLCWGYVKLCLLFYSVIDSVQVVDMKYLPKFHCISVIYHATLSQGRFQTLVPRRQWSETFWRWDSIWLVARKTSHVSGSQTLAIEIHSPRWLLVTYMCAHGTPGVLRFL